MLVITILSATLHWQVASGQVIGWGSSGPEVSRIQERLSQWGYYSGAVDGYYGNTTYRAVMGFQRQNGLSQDGVAGPITLAAMGVCDTAPQEQVVSRGAATGRGDLDLLAQVIEGEAADEPYLGKVAVGAVIANRTESASFPHTIGGVIFQEYAFESISNGQAYRPVTAESREAAQAALSGYDPTGGALFFWNPYKPVSSWIWSRPIITQIGNHVFAR